MPADKLEQLTKMLERQPTDPFLLYGVGMEHKKRGDDPKAIEFFTRVIESDPNYCYAYYQRGQAHERSGNVDLARESYQGGVDAARRTNDEHALSELQGALDMTN